ncbi:uncharacterized protein isoform X2 [Salmo salar]|uniref:Uncharacterized protein isoform X2 n=1 Tax=Salmo salar TaxID=8030 RepID=A0A1S3P352_SALSA|nr:uncharacterized protein LOC106582949 isoform X2 [Salmo salar]|eukprot:XP_014022068.1 PREDICTED: uncharacterized protein LOC106582949 isoform X2 [Salmo salar]
MRLCMDIAVPLLAMVHMTYICEAALLRKSTAADFLRPVREKRAAECFPAGCSMEDSEAEELLEANSHYKDSSKMLLNGGTGAGVNSSPGSEATVEEGSGM